MKHITPTQFYIHPVHVDLIGCGGTGSLVLSGLVRLHLAMKSLGHPYGLEVTAWDPDRVSQSNIGRQLYVESEVGLFKADCLINRCNMHFGLAWKAEARKFYTKAYYPAHSIIISCVDTRTSRAEINSYLPESGPYVIDAGNDDSVAQCLIGNGSEQLPYPYQVLPELIDTAIKEKNRPSCSLAESLGYQGLFMNQWTATAVLELIWQLFRKGGLDITGFYINLQTGRMNPVPIK